MTSAIQTATETGPKTETEIQTPESGRLAIDAVEPLRPFIVPKSQFYGLKNLVDDKLSPCVPWEFKPNVPPDAAKDKEAFRRWQSQPTTDHLFYTATEPLNPAYRPNKHNPAQLLHGFIADYDSKINEGMMESIQENCPPGMEPNWSCRTFSGGARLLWLFEQPLAMDSPPLAKAFLAHAKHELRLTKRLAGLDEGAWQNLHQLYDVGTDWKQLSAHPIPASTLNYWLFDAARKMDTSKLSDVIIPIDVIEQEVHRQYPGRWKGPFEIGARGVAFFNDGSDNPTAAIVVEGGMICFSREKLFSSWREIFGLAFVKKWEADKIGRVTADVYFDGKYYWLKSATDCWDYSSKDDFALRLRTRHRIDPAKGKGDTASEVDRVIAHVQEHRRVAGAGPRIYSQTETYMENGKKYLNISTVRAMPWNDLPQEWGKNFPWLAEFLDTCWADPVRLQRDYFFAWWQRFYMGAVWDSMSNGQALFLAGPVGRGKTLLTAIVTKAMGGSVDAGEFILGNTQFNKELFETGLWIVDDGVASNDPRLHKRYSELLKKVVANSTFNYMPKFRDAIKVPWKGRVIIALNDNDAGIGMIPLLEPSIEDKLMILRFSDALRRFPESADLGSIIDRELPYFLRWLSDWVMPEELRGESRFGCKSYIHPEIRVKAMNSGGLSDVIDIIKLWIKRHCAGNCRGPYWLGTAAEFMIELTGDEDIRPLVSKFSPQSLGRKLSQAADIYPELVSRDTTSQHKGDGGHYRICLAGDVEALPVSGVAVKFEPEDLEQIAA